MRAYLYLTALVALFCLGLRPVYAHCDTLDGPVVKDAAVALQKGDITPALKWVKPEYEGEIRTAFQKTLTVRQLSADARDLADRYFYETLVRLHRAGEGEPYTGLKPAGTEVDPAVVAADAALSTGSVEKLVKMVTTAVDAGIRDRFKEAAEAKAHANQSVQMGREYVDSYVNFVHYTERLLAVASNQTAHHEETAEAVHHEE